MNNFEPDLMDSDLARLEALLDEEEVGPAEKFKPGMEVVSTLSQKRGKVIEHPDPEGRPTNTVYVEFEGSNKLNCNPDNLELVS